jgi:hypothetical protein
MENDALAANPLVAAQLGSSDRREPRLKTEEMNYA